MKSVIRLESVREFKNSTKQTETATRYYITSLLESPKVLIYKVMAHWSVENKFHWILDAQFNEYQLRKRQENSALYYSVILKITLNL